MKTRLGTPPFGVPLASAVVLRVELTEPIVYDPTEPIEHDPTELMEVASPKLMLPRDGVLSMEACGLLCPLSLQGAATISEDSFLVPLPGSIACALPGLQFPVNLCEESPPE